MQAAGSTSGTVCAPRSLVSGTVRVSNKRRISLPRRPVYVRAGPDGQDTPSSSSPSSNNNQKTVFQLHADRKPLDSLAGIDSARELAETVTDEDRRRCYGWYNLDVEKIDEYYDTVCALEDALDRKHVFDAFLDLMGVAAEELSVLRVQEAQQRSANQQGWLEGMRQIARELFLEAIIKARDTPPVVWAKGHGGKETDEDISKT